MAFQEKPKSTAQKINKDDGEYREIFIEKHEKDADLRKQINRYEKTVGAVVQSRNDEGVIMRYPVANADAYQKAARDRANKLAKMPGSIKPDENYSGISQVDKNTIEDADIKDLMGS
jgi:hypothetical protein